MKNSTSMSTRRPGKSPIEKTEEQQWSNCARFSLLRSRYSNRPRRATRSRTRTPEPNRNAASLEVTSDGLMYLPRMPLGLEKVSTPFTEPAQ